MNTSKLKTFAQQSRRILMEGVRQKLRYWGFDSKGNIIDEPLPVGGGIILRGEIIDDPTIMPKWEALKQSIRRHGLEATIEEAAYTWFNRLLAIRILSKNGYDPAQLEYESSGSRLPVILAKARRGVTDYLSKSETERLQLFLTDYNQEPRAFAILITGYCHNHNLMNRVFGRLNDFTELLLPDNILTEKSFIHLLNTTDAISDDDYCQVELIGWLYQFYISEKKDEVFAGFKKNQKARPEDIPAATQIFTPNWIVKYMVQNTAGRIWLDHHPDSKLRSEMKYLVEPPKTTSESFSPLGGTEGGQHAPISQQPNLFSDSETSTQIPPPGETEGGQGLLPGGDPIHLKLLDPACGSGHILVEGFSLLYEMYMEEYYLPAEAVENILTRNLFGLELDLRAAQLARFAVLLAAANKVPEILKKDILPRIYAMPEPATFSRQEVLDFLGSEGTQHEKVFATTLQLMQQAQNLGSVMKFNVTETEREYFESRWQILKDEAENNTSTKVLTQKLEPFLNILFALTRQYEAIAANPPYMGQKNMNETLKRYVDENYSSTNGDLFAVFMEIMNRLISINGKNGIINQWSWMCLPSYQLFRENFLKKFQIENLLFLGIGVFPELNSKKVQNVALTYSPSFWIKHNAKFYKLDESFNVNIKRQLFEKRAKEYICLQSNFFKIPGSPISFWVNEKIQNEYSKGNNTLIDVLTPRQGLATSDNDRFLRIWHEVKYSKIDFSCKNIKDAKNSTKKWFPYRKGGDYRKWYGNNDYVINWKNFGKEVIDYATQLYKSPTRTIKNIPFYFKPSITWGLIALRFNARMSPSGFIFDVGGSSGFPQKEKELSILGFLNVKITSYLLSALNFTLNIQVGDIKRLLYISPDNSTILNIININVEELTNRERNEWDSHETSWDFQLHPLLPIQDDDYKICKIEDSYNNWFEEVSRQFYQLHTCEEELNNIFINLYDLNEELDPLVPIKDITILQEELDFAALEKTDKELRRSRQWRLENGKWQLYVNNQLVPLPAEGELPVCTVQPALPIKKDVVARQFISYAIGCMMGRYSLEKPGLILANQGETLEDYQRIIDDHYSANEAKRSHDNKAGLFLPDDDGIVPLMGSNCGFSDDGVQRLRHFIEVVWGSETLTQNINFLQSCLDMDLEKYLVSQNNFWKDHCSRYKKKPIYWLFSSKNGAFQVLVYMHRMTKYTVQKIRDNYLLKHLQWLNGQISQFQSRSSSLGRDDQKQLDWLRKAFTECEEYNIYLKDIADRQIEIDLDDGVSMNYPKFNPVVAEIK